MELLKAMTLSSFRQTMTRPLSHEVCFNVDMRIVYANNFFRNARRQKLAAKLNCVLNQATLASQLSMSCIVSYSSVASSSGACIPLLHSPLLVIFFALRKLPSQVLGRLIQSSIGMTLHFLPPPLCTHLRNPPLVLARMTMICGTFLSLGISMLAALMMLITFGLGL